MNSLLKNKTKLLTYIAWLSLGVWMLMHIPGILYGTHNIPIHETYVGDEQVSVNSALRVLNEKNIFAFRNREMQYYGPMFVIADMPGVVLDFASKYLTGVVSSGEEYKNYIIWDWGGIIRNIRVTGLMSMALGLIVAYMLMATRTLNRSGSRYMPYIAPILLASNYYFFEWSHFATHWVYVLPLLLVQLYTLVRIHETDGGERRYWLLHACAVVVSFGVSYFSAIFLVLWFPWLFVMWRKKDWSQIKKFTYTMGGVVLGWVAIIAWHPYAFMRYLSFLGIGTPLHNQGDALNPLAFGDTSFDYYTGLLTINHLGLVCAFLLLVFVLRHLKPWRSFVLWTLLAPGIMNYLLFAPQAHPEGRYMLPTIVSLLLAFSWLLAQYASHESVRTRLVTIVLGTLIVWNFGFHLVHDVLWMRIFSWGPLQEEALEMALELQKNGSPILIINSPLWGHPHTKDSYRAYAVHKGFGDVPLYREIYANPLPSDRTPLDAQYMTLKEYEANPSSIIPWEHVILVHRPRAGEWNQFTYFDGNILRNWHYRDLSVSYLVLK